MEGFEFLNDFASDGAIDQKVETLKIKKGQSLVFQGQILTSLFWIKSGLFREYHHDGEEEFTQSFLVEGDFYLTGFYFIDQKKSSFTVEALEPSTVQVLNMDFLINPNLNARQSLEILKHISTKKYEHNLAWKLINGRRSFLKRWECFNERYPKLWYRIPQKHIACFFRVTPQYLSKLKSNRLL